MSKRLVIFAYTVIIGLSLASQCLASEQPELNNIRILTAKSSADASHSYFVELLKLVSKNSHPRFTPFNIELIRVENYNHESVVRLLMDDFIDVIWTGTSEDSERRLLPIHIPIIRGLLGYRVSIVHKDNLAMFKSKGLYAYRDEIACQGTHWPDARILANNGFSVHRVGVFDQIFELLNRKKCTYFPRAIFEAYAELASVAQKHPDLTIFDDVILHYPLPYFFHVHKNNHQLAEQITFGLTESLENGSYEKLMKTHALTNALFPLNKWKNKFFIRLENAEVPANYLPTPGSLITLY